MMMEAIGLLGTLVNTHWQLQWHVLQIWLSQTLNNQHE